MFTQEINMGVTSLETMLTWIQEISSKDHRRPGTVSGLWAEQYLEQELAKTPGCQVSTQKIPLTNWEANEWRLEVLNKEIPSHYIPYTNFTEAEGVEAPLVYLGEGTLKETQTQDLKGKIVVVDLVFPVLNGKQLSKLALSVHDPEKVATEGDLHEATWIRPAWNAYQKAVEQGALGFIGILANQPGGHDSYYAPYGFKEGDNILKKPLPGLWVGREAGVALREMAQEKQKARLSLTGTKRPSYSNNIMGLLPGESDDLIILGCHHDSPFKGVTEDASGCAVVLSIAQTIAAREKPLKHSVLVLLTAGHFYGSIGTRRFIESHPELIDKTTAEIHIEHIAKEAREVDGVLELTGRPEPCGLFVPYNKTAVTLANQMIQEYDLTPTLVLPASGPLGAYPPTDGGDFYEAGVPVFNHICNPVYLLVDDDSSDKLLREKLVPTAKAYYSLIQKIDQLPKGALMGQNYPIKQLLGKFASWKTQRKVVRQYGADAHI
jgi:hypothetical protein